ncbi:MAG: tRNA (adenosine(37)-N6)-dimethylallyltransferase MiaA, partial [Acidobacteriia bacterium]|nr:tRNA (adenosine(37)-N6)-dimethylallyltransferase MiaA [Terriglobia bacterium]
MGPLNDDHPLVVIVGPTAAGKSALAIFLAERWTGEIINCDSVQVYRGFDIGTGKVAMAERRGIPHHLLDVVEPGEVFTAGDYRQQATRVLEAVRQRGRLPIVVGGTGLYLRALLEGLFEGPQRSEEVRARLAKIARRRGREFLHGLLRRLDPKAAARVHPRDTSKITRALEVCMLARQPISAMQASGRAGLRGFRVLKIGLSPDRKQLARRINARVERMFASGLLEET